MSKKNDVFSGYALKDYVTRIFLVIVKNVLKLKLPNTLTRTQNAPRIARRIPRVNHKWRASHE